MKCRKMFVLMIAAVTMLSLSALAKTKNEGNLTVDEPLQVGSMQLMPGHYKVEWNGPANQVKVNIMEHNKTLATVPAKLVTHAKPSPYDALVTTEPTSKRIEQLKEIDFNNRTQALVLEPNRMVKN